MAHSIPFWLLWAEIECMMLKGPIKPFKQVEKSRKQTLRAYCPNMYTIYPVNIRKAKMSLMVKVHSK